MAAKSFKEIFLETWIPQAVTAVLAAVAIIWGVPAVQQSFAAATASSERKLEIFEHLSSSAVVFVHSMRLIRDYANEPIDGLSKEKIEEKTKKFDLAEQDAKSSFDSLIKTIPIAFVIYSPKAQEQLQIFEKWARLVRQRDFQKLPSTEEMNAQLSALLASLRVEVSL